MNAANDNEPMNLDDIDPARMTRFQFAEIQKRLELSDTELADKLGLSPTRGPKRIRERKRGLEKISERMALDMIGLLREARDERAAS